MRRSLLALLLPALLAACGTPQAQPLDGTADDGYYGVVLEQRYRAPDITLTDTAGQPWNFRTDTSRPLTLVFFGYTHCPDICQVVMATLASAMTRLTAEEREQVEVVFVTTDPARDDPATLAAYLGHFDPSFRGVTGDLSAIIRAGKPLAVAVEQGEKLPSGGYEVTHGTHVLAIDGDDQVPILWTQGTSSAEFATDLAGILASPLEEK